MNRALSAASVLTVCVVSLVTGPALAGGEKSVKDPLPAAGKVEWDVRAFEDHPHFKVVKRELRGKQIVWVLENREFVGTSYFVGWQANYLDADGVRVGSVQIRTEPSIRNTSQGERNRFILNLPSPEYLKNIRKVVITGW